MDKIVLLLLNMISIKRARFYLEKSILKRNKLNILLKSKRKKRMNKKMKITTKNRGNANTRSSIVK